jgi:hypothetical protein
MDKSKQNDRKKGLEYVREGREILRRDGFVTEGPGYQVIRVFPKETTWMPMGERKKLKPQAIQVHKDYFGVFDLITFREDRGFEFHQFSILEEKSRKIRDIQGSGMPGWFWGRFEEGRRVGFKRFFIRDGKIEEDEICWLSTRA